MRTASQAQITANRRICKEQHALAVERYYENPKKCKHCGKVIEVPDGKRPAEARKKRFCNHSCATSFNNARRYAGRKKQRPKKKKRVGSILDNMTKAQVRDRYKDPFRYKIALGKHARAVFNRSDKEKKCRVCGYDTFCEISHVRAVADFPETALVKDINSIDNLVPLCPNHHKEYDHNLLSKEDKKKIAALV